MRIFVALCCVSILLFGMVGCGAFGGFGPGGHGNVVTLESNNFSVLKSGIEGSATVMVLFPINLPILGAAGLPLGEADLYNKAMAELKKKLPKKENVGLVNLTVDSRLKSFVVVGWFTVTLTADVVEFK